MIPRAASRKKYAEAIKMGKPEQKKNKVHVLDTTIQQLIICLQTVKQTGVSIKYHHVRNRNNNRKPIKKFKGGKETVLNLFKIVLNKSNYKLF